MSRTYATPLELDLIPSRSLQRLLLLVHALAAFSILLLPIAVVWQLSGILLLLLHYHQGQKQPGCHLVWQQGNQWRLTSSGQTVDAHLQPGSVLLPWLVLLVLKDESGKIHRICVFPDSIRTHAFRRLRVRLKIERGSLFAPSAAE